MSVSNYGENQMLEKIPGTVYVKLHTGDPGEEGTANAAVEATRKAITLGAAASGVRKNTTAAEYTNVAGTETYSYVSYWDAVSGGNCWGSGPLAEAKSVTAGESIVFPVGELSYALD